MLLPLMLYSDTGRIASRFVRPAGIAGLVLVCLLSGACNRDTRPWQICYRLYDQCTYWQRSATGDWIRDAVSSLDQHACEAYVARQPEPLIEAMLLCVREGHCRRGLAQRCVDKPHHYDLAHPTVRSLLKSGFGGKISVDRQPALVARATACLQLPLLPWRRVRFVLDGGALYQPQRVLFSLNGTRFADATLTDARQSIEAVVGGDRVRNGPNTLCLRHDAIKGGAADRSVGKTQTRSPVDIAVSSAGYLGGNRAAIWVDGKDLSLDRRGLNAVAIDPGSGAASSATHFDLYANSGAGRRFSDWVKGLGRGVIVALAVRDEASRHFDRAAKEALERLGATQDLSGKYRFGYAAIGVKDAPRGSAVERASARGVARIVVGAMPRSWLGRAHYRRLTVGR